MTNLLLALALTLLPQGGETAPREPGRPESLASGAAVQHLLELELEVARLRGRLEELERLARRRREEPAAPGTLEASPSRPPESPSGPDGECDEPVAGVPATPAHPASARTPLDRTGLARAARRAGRPELALALLPAGPGDPESLYERARCLEALGRHAEALGLLEQARAATADAHLIHVLEEDLEYLAWRTSERAIAPPASSGGGWTR